MLNNIPTLCVRRGADLYFVSPRTWNLQVWEQSALPVYVDTGLFDSFVYQYKARRLHIGDVLNIGSLSFLMIQHDVLCRRVLAVVLPSPYRYLAFISQLVEVFKSYLRLSAYAGTWRLPLAH